MPFLHPPFLKSFNRVISVVPSQTELLYSLGLEDEVIGITKFCVHPDKWFKTKTRIGGTKNLRMDEIRKLQPDLILANKEENTREEIEILSQEFNVYVSDITNLDSALKMIREVGQLTNKLPESIVLINQIRDNFNYLKKFKPFLKVAYLIWQDPYMTVGGDTFINDMLERCGLENVFQDLIRYPEITIEDLNASGCNLVLLSSEPYPFKEKHIQEIERKLPNTKCLLVDGECFSWYGSRMLVAANYFNDLHDEIKNGLDRNK